MPQNRLSDCLIHISTRILLSKTKAYIKNDFLSFRYLCFIKIMKCLVLYIPVQYDYFENNYSYALENDLVLYGQMSTTPPSTRYKSIFLGESPMAKSGLIVTSIFDSFLSKVIMTSQTKIYSSLRSNLNWRVHIEGLPDQVVLHRSKTCLL